MIDVRAKDGFIPKRKVIEQIKNAGVELPSLRLIRFFYEELKETDAQDAQKWFRPRVTFEQMKQIFTEGKFAELSKQTLDAINKSDNAKREEVWKQATEFANKKFQEFGVFKKV